MKSIILYSSLVLTSVHAIAQNAPIFPGGNASTGPHNTGTVLLRELAEPDSLFNYSLAYASFARGAKLDWHYHPAGQYLLITEGVGYYQERGKTARMVSKGDVIRCLPGVEHWHGASSNATFAYIGATPSQKGKTVWKDRVTDEEYNRLPQPGSVASNAKDELISLSKQKWIWMSEKNVDTLNALFNANAKFVHMGATMDKTQELNTIRTGGIHYKRADIEQTSVEFIGNTAILLSKLKLLAVVGGNEVTNPFVVTEVYIRDGDKWSLGSMSFTRLLGQ